MSAPAHGGPDKEEEIQSSQPREMGKEEKNTRSGPGVLRRELEKENVCFMTTIILSSQILEWQSQDVLTVP